MDPFAAAGTLADAYRRVDWATTPLGPVDAWSPTLRSTLDLALNSRFPVTLIWGPEYVLVYNEAYVQMIGDKHPAALGERAEVVFAEIWDTIGAMLRRVSSGAGTEWVENLELPMNRHGFLEETYFTFSYSAVTGPSGEIEGVIDIASETTAEILGRRRLELLSRLNDRLSDLDHPRELIDRVLPVLRTVPNDLADVTIELPGGLAPGQDFALADRQDGPVVSIRLAPDATFVAQLSPRLAPDDRYLGFVRLIGTALSQALSRSRQREAERRAAELERQMSESLQRSLLTPPPKPDGLDFAVRYRSAVEQAQVGGDWYDAFELPDGRLTMVVGDVTGHDREAAAAMAQLRNLLRGISYTLRHQPSRVLAGLDDALHGLGVAAFATVLLAHVGREGRDGSRSLQWSNAGHLPPALIEPDGTVRLLSTRPELLIGVHANPPRTDHTTMLAPGSSLVFYSDGLVERRGQPLDEGLQALVDALAGTEHRSADALCDHLLGAFGPTSEDDVVLAVLRVNTLDEWTNSRL
ncbi:PP2C family protein-serine/threonine phosphatase [Cryptosporangium phraense]|uniref:Serine/threonine-protein phosphatase n=1 Tax=Cryptosporangium phraense TaxID=2593070 RepID=A0A545AXI6_9ACTN|nr:PP2C family protein-serine/threonine phosphatase [Cryptosporangium phraense]TQS46042.1 serine/threonine-protein phosphatase [Cryptosporangium phraense]